MVRVAPASASAVPAGLSPSWSTSQQDVLGLHLALIKRLRFLESLLKRQASFGRQVRRDNDRRERCRSGISGTRPPEPLPNVG